MNFKWIEFLIRWILNTLDRNKSGSDKENWIFSTPIKYINLNQHEAQMKNSLLKKCDILLLVDGRT